MNTYRTILGQSIRLGSLPSNEVSLVHEILEEKERYGSGEEGPQPAVFASAAQKWIRAEFPLIAHFQEALRGPIGAVYRDCYYRLLAEEISKGDREERQRIFENLRANPARVLYDRYLDGGYTQSELADAAGLNEATISRLFSRIRKLEATEGPAIQLQRFQQACANLSLVLLGEDFPAEYQSVGETPFVRALDDFTVRERQLLRLVAAVTRHLFHSSTSEPPAGRREACRAFLALHLSAQYGIDNVDILDRFTQAILEEIEGARDINADSLVVLSEESLEQGQTLLEHLLIGFQMGVTFEGRHILFSHGWIQGRLLHHQALEGQNRETERLDPALDAYSEEVRAGWRSCLKLFEEWYQHRFMVQEEENSTLPSELPDTPMQAPAEIDVSRYMASLEIEIAMTKFSPDVPVVFPSRLSR